MLIGEMLTVHTDSVIYGRLGLNVLPSDSENGWTEKM